MRCLCQGTGSRSCRPYKSGEAPVGSEGLGGTGAWPPERQPLLEGALGPGLRPQAEPRDPAGDRGVATGRPWTADRRREGHSRKSSPGAHSPAGFGLGGKEGLSSNTRLLLSHPPGKSSFTPTPWPLGTDSSSDAPPPGSWPWLALAVAPSPPAAPSAVPPGPVGTGRPAKSQPPSSPGWGCSRL